ncbi:MAG: EAL domain-containing protein [Snowella sp.]|nr:EAL domain-containing protein [Snowella sp.]
MQSAFDPDATVHVDLSLEGLPEVQLIADKFVLWFQPVYELETGKVIHNEVLVRWRDKKGNLKSPQELFSYLQGTKLLWQLDRIVVAKAIDILVEQRDVILSVNLSAEVLEDPDFLGYVRDRLTQAQVDPKRLSFELPEIWVQKNFSTALAFMQTLKKLGCSVVLDSCTGAYFSLQQWQVLPIDQIKLDRDLTAQLQSHKQQLLASALIKTNRLFNRHCIAKGIDNLPMLTLVRKLGIQGAQGYFLNSPNNKPNTFISFGLFSTSLVSLLLLLYLFKSALGINIFSEKHAWEVLIDFIQPFFEQEPEPTSKPRSLLLVRKDLA